MKFILISLFLFVALSFINTSHAEADQQFIAKFKNAVALKDKSKFMALIHKDGALDQALSGYNTLLEGLFSAGELVYRIEDPSPEAVYTFERGGVTYTTNLSVTKVLFIEDPTVEPNSGKFSTYEFLLGVIDGKFYITTTTIKNPNKAVKSTTGS
ncbi:MAG: hypothetical protein AAGH40_13290 [Verrucomicrobiota bacterium]